MQALVVFESVYGNTHTIADAIARGLASTLPVVVVPAAQATPARVADADLVVVGGPTHVHGMSWTDTRMTAVRDEQDKARKADPVDSAHALDEAAAGEGLRSWFHDLAEVEHGFAVAFDTRYDNPVALTGSAARGIDRRLGHHGFDTLDEPTSFFVTDARGPLVDGEEQRAHEWGETLGARLETTRAPSASTG